MDSLILIKKNAKFDVEKTYQALQKISGVSELRRDKNVSSALNCDFDFNGVTTTMYLSKDLKRVSMRPLNDAAAILALKIQSVENRALTAFNQGGDFDFSLENVSNVKEFWERVEAAMNTEELAM